MVVTVWVLSIAITSGFILTKNASDCEGVIYWSNRNIKSFSIPETI